MHYISSARFLAILQNLDYNDKKLDKNMNISIGSDHNGLALKEALIKYLATSGANVKDCGPYNQDTSDYPDYASKVCADIIENTSDKGILICNTGIGMSIAANRFKNIRAALCVNELMAVKARQHNDANVLVLGAKLVDEATAIKLVEIFLKQDFEGGRHLARLSKIS